MKDFANLAESKEAGGSYVDRINRVIDHIHRHIAGSLRLEDLAEVAHFSPFHFHRIFKSMTGETLNAFVKRIRLDRALYLLSHGGSSTLTDVALECGFSSSADFSRSFRKQFGIAPSAFDVASYRRMGRTSMQDRLTGPDSRHVLDRLLPGQNPDGFEARLHDLKPRRVAYIRVWQPFEEGRVPAAANRLLAWAKDHGLEGNQWLGYMWEDPDIVDLDRCRYDVAVVVPDRFDLPTERPEGISIHDFPAMRVAEVAISGAIDLEQRALDWLFGTWLPRSSYVPDHQPTFEAWDGLPFEHGYAHFELSVQLPVVRE